MFIIWYPFICWPLLIPVWSRPPCLSSILEYMPILYESLLHCSPLNRIVWYTRRHPRMCYFSQPAWLDLAISSKPVNPAHILHLAWSSVSFSSLLRVTMSESSTFLGQYSNPQLWLDRAILAVVFQFPQRRRALIQIFLTVSLWVFYRITVWIILLLASINSSPKKNTRWAKQSTAQGRAKVGDSSQALSRFSGVDYPNFFLYSDVGELF